MTSLAHQLMCQFLTETQSMGNASLLQSLNPIHLRRVEKQVEQSHPLSFILPAFPAKSPNPDKTISALPDLGELLALKRLNQICHNIGRHYAPGAEIKICSDGRVFSHIVHVEDQTITQYGAALERMINEHGLAHLSLFSLDDLFPSLSSFGLKRSKLMETFDKSIEQIRYEISTNPHQQALFNGMHRFLFEDALGVSKARGETVSKNQLKERTKKETVELIQASDAWSSAIHSVFPLAVRLSIHPQTHQSSKIGLQLLPSSDPWRTPWHSVVVLTPRGAILMKRVDAIAMGATPECSPISGLPHFKMKPLSPLKQREDFSYASL